MGIPLNAIQPLVDYLKSTNIGIYRPVADAFMYVGRSPNFDMGYFYRGNLKFVPAADSITNEDVITGVVLPSGPSVTNPGNWTPFLLITVDVNLTATLGVYINAEGQGINRLQPALTQDVAAGDLGPGTPPPWDLLFSIGDWSFALLLSEGREVNVERVNLAIHK